MFRPHFLCQIVETHDKSCEPLLDAQRGNFGELQNRLRHFDHGPEPAVQTHIQVFHEIGDLDDIIRIQYFRHQHGIGAGKAGLLEVLCKPGGFHGIDAHDQLALAVFSRLQGSAGILAGFFLGVGRHGIFQIEDDRVSGQAFCLFQCACVGRGHVQAGAAGAVSGLCHA